MLPKMHTKHIVSKTSTRDEIKGGNVYLPGVGSSMAIIADGTHTTKIIIEEWMTAVDLRCAAKLFKKLADALDNVDS